MEDGDVLPLGNVDARVLRVPGHTPEHLALIVTDQTRGPERRLNRAFSLSDEEMFLRLMLQEIPPRPERAQEIRAASLGLPCQ